MKMICRFSICLIVSMFGACRPSGFEIGGGGSTHHPPDRIILGKQTLIELELSVWGEGAGKPSKRWSHVMCYYRIVGDKEYAKLPMTPKQEHARKILFTCMIPPQNRAEKTLEYYFDMRLDGHYNRRDGSRVLIAREGDTGHQVSKPRPTENDEAK